MQFPAQGHQDNPQGDPEATHVWLSVPDTQLQGSLIWQDRFQLS
jgi:hypothetical protein